MTDYYWNSGVDDDFLTPTAWNPQGVPQKQDAAFVNVAGTYNVTVNASEVAWVNGLSIDDANATLALNGGQLTVDDTLTSAGAITMDNGATYSGAYLTAAAIQNTGSMNIDTFDGSGGAYLGDFGDLSSSGPIVVGNADLSASTNVVVNTLNSQSDISVTGATQSGAAAKATVWFHAYNAAAKLDDALSVSGNAALDGVAITSIGATGSLSLSGSAASFDGATSASHPLALTLNQGAINLDEGAQLNIAAGFANSGLITVASADSGSELTIGGDATNSGRIIVNSNAAGSNPNLDIGGNLINSGLLNIGASVVNSAASTAMTINTLQDTGLFSIGGGAGTTSVEVAGTATVSQHGAIIVFTGSTFSASSLDATNQGTINVEGGVVSAPITVDNGSLLLVNQQNGVDFAAAATLDDGGREIVDGGSTVAGATISGGELDLDDDVTMLSAVTFDAAGGKLGLYGATPQTNLQVDGVNLLSKIDLYNVVTASQPILLNNSTQHNVLQITETNSALFDIQLDPNADYSRVQFTAQTDPGGSGTLISENACYGPGTLILTQSGERPVEALVVGDLAITASGVLRPIRWIGRRRVDCRSHPAPETVWPYRVLAGAFAPGLPSRDLLLSPDHCVVIDTAEGPAFVSIRTLENGATIAQTPVDEIVYRHVELDAHSVIFANGLPAESFLDCGNRRAFDGAVTSLRPQFAPARRDGFCLPVLSDGAAVAEARRRLRLRAEALGWLAAWIEPSVGLLADGEWIEAEAGRFCISAQARDVRLISTVFTPLHFESRLADRRRLGVGVAGLKISSGRGERIIGLDHVAFGEGFYEIEDGHGFRWTNGEARLSADLWRGECGFIELEFDLIAGARRFWQAPDPRVSARYSA
jgi:hypothetical protein